MNRTRYQDLLSQLAEIERQHTLPHSDQHMLDQAWEDINDQLDELDELSGEERPPTPIPQEPVRIAPPPPPKTESSQLSPGAVPVCNCDSDGECEYCEEERINAWRDDREGCDRCSGCHYCQDSQGYDEDEI